MKYAIDELSALIAGLPRDVDENNLSLRYISALFAELAYRHIPKWEFDSKKRALLVPCAAHQDIVLHGSPSDVVELLSRASQSEGQAFVVESQRTVVVGYRIAKFLFLGFRGTQFLFDWPVNLRSKLISLSTHTFDTGLFHRGFAEEAVRISTRIQDELRRRQLGGAECVVISGHSLGGAVAAISAGSLPFDNRIVCIMASPRYANLNVYLRYSTHGPVQVRRPGDIVPTVPPLSLGYADHPKEFDTSGNPYIDPKPFTGPLGELARWASFLFGLTRPHSMEEYRKEMGRAAQAVGAELDLACYEKLEPAHLTNTTPNISYHAIVYLEGPELSKWEFADRVRKLPHAQQQSRYIRPTGKNLEWAQFELLADEPLDPKQLWKIGEEVGVQVQGVTIAEKK